MTQCVCLDISEMSTTSGSPTNQGRQSQSGLRSAAVSRGFPADGDPRARDQLIDELIEENRSLLSACEALKGKVNAEAQKVRR